MVKRLEAYRPQYHRLNSTISSSAHIYGAIYGAACRIGSKHKGGMDFSVQRKTLFAAIAIAALDAISTGSNGGYCKYWSYLMAEAKKCGCGRSPSGKCIGWHGLSEEEYQKKLVAYQARKTNKGAKAA